MALVLQTMRKLLRLAGLTAGFCAVLWVLRERLVRMPEALPETPSGFRTAMPEDSIPASSDDLTAVTGIGPVYSQRLRSAGVTTFAALASADVQELSQAIDVSAAQVAGWVEQARELT